ncbi:MAG: hypothetical protein RR516_07185 [Erysipelotrichaceae bacterium]
MAINIKEELKKLKIYTISNEELYKFSEFEKNLQLINFETFESDDCILTPYYIDNNKIYELYAYELNVRIVDESDFESYVKKITGKERIEDVADEIIELHKNCYIEITASKSLPKRALQEYISYSKKSKQIKSEIQKMFSYFDKDNLYFEVY